MVAMKRRMFPTNVQGQYYSITLQYSAIVSGYCPGWDSIPCCMGPLPCHLTVMELAHSLFDEAVALSSLMAANHTVHRASTQDHDFHLMLPSPAIPMCPSVMATSFSLTSCTPLMLQHTILELNYHPPHMQGFQVSATQAPPPLK